MTTKNVGELSHELKNAEQQIVALKSIVGRAADALDTLAEADCDEAAVANAEKRADQLRDIARG
ncbi:hypothetical protein MKP08_13940 [Erythrobacter sp. LQ02-29]|uniref:hypothetical protein n=1 Tax=Erythrobacter sp. LQ02-29 TaxID=2920384 RepID=UPI001F4D4B9F|nr:hypothetical protein [Erythrobacter sp. LQ02-29]MCP9223844.1 hypothetical protein [Erythrobacter sp. LQ02-29]